MCASPKTSNAHSSRRENGLKRSWCSPMRSPCITGERIVGLASKHRLPDIYALFEFIEVGGLMAYGVDHLVLFRRAADYVDKIPRGARPTDLPINGNDAQQMDPPDRRRRAPIVAVGDACRGAYPICAFPRLRR